jgi:hypothetical protein
VVLRDAVDALPSPVTPSTTEASEVGTDTSRSFAVNTDERPADPLAASLVRYRPIRTWKADSTAATGPVADT